MRARRGLIVLAAAVVMLLPVGAVRAAIAPSTFEGDDGDLVASPDMKDWDNVGAAAHDDLPSGGSDNSINGAEDDTTVKVTLGSIQPNKSDLTSWRIATESVGTPPRDFLYLGWSRVADPSGNVNIDFELNKLDQGPVPTTHNSTWNLKRSAGDKLITFDLVGGGNVPELGLLTWLPVALPGGIVDDDCYGQPNSTGPCWGGRKVLNPNSNPPAEAAVGLSGSDIVFGEAAINLQASGIFEAGVCTNFGSAYAKSRSSGSGFQAQLSDFISPRTVTVNNCGDLTVVKNTGAVGENGTFTFDIDCSDNTFDATDVSITTIGGTGSATLTDIHDGTTCSVTEDAAAGWTLVRTSPSPATVTIDGDKSVTFTNSRDKGAITVTKSTTGGDGTFTFTVSCPQISGYPKSLSITTTAGTGSASTPADIPTGTTCSVTEDPQSGVWTPTSAARQDVAVTGASQTVAFANSRDMGKIVINKDTTGGDGTFSFTVACRSVAGYPQTLSITTTSGAGSAETAANIPTGTTCTVTEAAQTGRWTVVGSAERSVLVDGPSVNVVFSNVRDVGSLVVTEATTGGDGSFPYTVDCDGTTFDAAGTITTAGGAGSAPKIASIPTGTSCTVAQASVAGWTLTSASPQTVIINGDEVVPFANTRNVNGIVIDKSSLVASATEGQAVGYTYAVTATGPDSLHDVTVTDDRCGPVNFEGGDTDSDSMLDPGETWTYGCVAAADSAHPKNIGTATGFDPAGAKVTDTDEVTIAIVAGVVLRASDSVLVPAVAGPAPAAAAAPAVIPDLPRTGGAFADLLMLGGALILLGVSLRFVSRRRLAT